MNEEVRASIMAVPPDYKIIVSVHDTVSSSDLDELAEILDTWSNSDERVLVASNAIDFLIAPKDVVIELEDKDECNAD